MSKVTPLKAKSDLCPYCAQALATEHPGWSCPRIASFTWEPETGALQVEYWPPEDMFVFEEDAPASDNP